jgi:hypothetical protein
MGIVIPFRRRPTPLPPPKVGEIESDIDAIMAIMSDLAYPSRILLLTGVALRVFQTMGHGDTLWIDRAAKAFARGLYHEISGR